jgi:predicted nucleotidyltransferase
MMPTTILERLARTVEEAAPGVARSLYLTGSFASGEAVEGSELDIVVVVAPDAPRAAVVAMTRAARDVAERSGLAIDFKSVSEAELFTGTPASVFLKLGGRVFAGADITSEIVLPPLDRFIDDRMQNAACLVAYALRDREHTPALPLSYPTPSGEFYGYVRRGSTRDAVTIAGWAMNALVAKAEQRYVVSKLDALSSFAALNEPFSPFAQKLLDRCRGAWGYCVPESAEERAELRAIFAEMRSFENHFLDCFGVHLAGLMQTRRESSAIVASALAAMVIAER